MIDHSYVPGLFHRQGRRALDSGSEYFDGKLAVRIWPELSGLLNQNAGNLT